MTVAREPVASTLRRYGLTAEEWRRILKRQRGGCGVCGLVPESGTLHIDHEHVRGWRRMTPLTRRQFVRGLLCWFDNGVLLRRGATPERLRNAAKYLETYERRKK